MFNFWGIFLFITGILIILILGYFLLIEESNEIIWKILYGILSWLFLFIYFFYEAELLLEIFIMRIGDVIILKDLQDLVNLSIDLAYIFSCWFFLPTLICLYVTYMKNYWTWQEYKTKRPFLLLFIYYFILFKFFLDNDLFLTSWDFFNTNMVLNYDFQPDFMLIILSYLGDFSDLGLYFCLLFICFWVSNTITPNMLNWYKKKMFLITKVCVTVLISCLMFYFFGGESFNRDCFIVLLTFIFLESFFIFYLFLFNLKRKIL